MRITPDAFDTEQLYTAHWRAPHHDYLDRVQTPPVLKQTRAGRLIESELAERNLAPSDVAIDLADAHMIVAIPRGLGATATVIPLETISGEAICEVRRLLDVARANLIRERMMRAAGWQPGDPEPEWAQMTTPLAKHILSLGGVRAVDLWQLPSRRYDAFGRIEGGCEIKGDCRDAIPDGFAVHKVGSILKIEGDLGGRAAFAQGDHTRIVVPTHSPARGSVAFDGQRVKAFGFSQPGPVAAYLREQRVRSVRRNPTNPRNSLILDIEMPVITMETVPQQALEAVGLANLPAELRIYPMWISVKRVPDESDVP